MNLRKKRELEDSLCRRAINQKRWGKTNIFWRKKKKSDTPTSRWRPSKPRLQSCTLMSSATLGMDMKIPEEHLTRPTRGHGLEQGQLRGRAGRQGMEVKVHSMDLTEMIIQWSKSAKAPSLKAIAKQPTRSLTQNQLNPRLKLDHMASHNQNGKLDWEVCISQYNLRLFSSQSTRVSGRQSRRTFNNIRKQKEEDMNVKDHPRQESRPSSIKICRPERLRGNPTHPSSSMVLLVDVLQITSMLDQTQSTTESSQPWSTAPSAPASSCILVTPDTSTNMLGRHPTSLQLWKSPSVCWRLNWMANTLKRSKCSKTTGLSS